MSAEAWRRKGTYLTPQLFVWQAWHFQHLGLALRGRRGTFGTSIDVSGSLATKGDVFDAAAFCVAGVTLSALQARFAWQAWYFRYLHRCQRKLGDEVGLTWRRGLLTWQACHFQHLRLDLRGRRGTFRTFIDVRGSLATNWD